MAENETSLSDASPDGQEQDITFAESSAKTDVATDGGEGDSATTIDAFDASSYEQSFGLPADTLKGVEDAESALEIIREYTDKTLTAGLLSDAANIPTGTGGEQEHGTIVVEPGKKAASKNPELDSLRAELTEVKESLAARDKTDHDMRVAEINHRVDSEIDVWSSPKYGTSKSRNFQQAKAFKELQDLVRTHIAGSQAQGKAPPIVESLLRQVRAFHDDSYKPTLTKVNEDLQLGSPGTGSRSTKSGEGPNNIHEALIGSSQ